MYDNYNYPPNADTPDAPWNETEREGREFPCRCSVSLSKSDCIVSNAYVDEVVQDEDGCYRYTDTSYIEWDADWKEQHFTIPQMLDELKKYIEKELNSFKVSSKPFSDEDRKRKWKLRDMLEDCQGWEVDDVYIEQE